MEMKAVIEGLRWFANRNPTELHIWTDSSYVIQGITAWIFGWKSKGWKTQSGQEVLNKEFWMELFDLTQKFPRGSLKWNYVPGHSGISGNERCDQIAVAFSQGQSPFLFDGNFKNYGHSLEIPDHITGALPQRSSGSQKSSKAKTYLSYLHGEVFRHFDWASCERRVKGQAGAKFKKSTHTLSEEEILKSWNLPPGTPIKEA